MLSLLQILLKILGIILLSILGILVVLLLVVLLVPVRYGVKGSYKEEFICHGKVTWLLHLVSITFDYEKQLQMKIKIFGIPLSVFRKNAVDKTEEIVEKAGDKTSEILSEVVADKTVENDDPIIEETTPQPKIQSTIESLGMEQEMPEKKSFFQKIKLKIQEVIGKIRQVLSNVSKGIRSAKTKKDTLQHYISVLRREEVKKAFSLCKKRLWILIKHILPKKMKVTADFGFDDPSATGYVLAVHGILPVSVGKKIILHPDFEHSLFVCNFKIKGAVNAWSLLHQLLCIISDKNCRALYQIVKKEILNERK